MNNRRFRRVPFEAEVTLTHAQETWSCQLLDVALRGALLACSETLSIPFGSHCHIHIALQGSSLALDFEAELVHKEEGHYGFIFLSEDLETLTHLRKLLELNTGDAETTREEMDAWLSG